MIVHCIVTTITDLMVSAYIAAVGVCYDMRNVTGTLLDHAKGPLMPTLIMDEAIYNTPMPQLLQQIILHIVISRLCMIV